MADGSAEGMEGVAGPPERKPDARANGGEDARGIEIGDQVRMIRGRSAESRLVFRVQQIFGGQALCRGMRSDECPVHRWISLTSLRRVVE